MADNIIYIDEYYYSEDEDEYDSEDEVVDENEVRENLLKTMEAHFQDPEKSNAYPITIEPRYLLSVFNTLSKENVASIKKLIIDCFFNTKEIVEFVDYNNIDLGNKENMNAFIEICKYFPALTTLYFDENNINLSSIVLLLTSLLESNKTMTKLAFQDNSIYSTEQPTEIEINKFKRVLELICNLNISELSFIECFGHFANTQTQSECVINLLIEGLKESNVSTLNLSFCYLNNEDTFLQLLCGLEENLKKIYFICNIETNDINKFMKKLVNRLCEPRNIITECEIKNEDYYYEGPEITDTTLSYVEEKMNNNFSLMEFEMSEPRINEIIQPFLDRNQYLYWEIKHNSYFCNDDTFSKLLIAFFLLNFEGNNKKLPKLPLIICIKIFGMFNRIDFN